MSDLAVVVTAIVALVVVFALVGVFTVAIVLGKGLWFRGRYGDTEVGLATVPGAPPEASGNSKDTPE